MQFTKSHVLLVLLLLNFSQPLIARRSQKVASRSDKSTEKTKLHRDPAPNLDLKVRDLEVRVWNAEDEDLPALEREVVRTIQINPHSALAHYLLAHTLVRLFAANPGDLQLLKQASEVAQQALDLDPRQDFGYVAMADIFDLMGTPERGMALLNDAEKSGLHPSWRFYFARARLTADQTQNAKILGLFEMAMAFTDAKREIIAPYVIAVLKASEQDAELVRRLQNWNQKFPTSLFELNLALALAEQGEIAAAEKTYAELLTKEPENHEAKINKAILLYRDLKKADVAVKIFEEVLNIDHKQFHPPRETKASLWAHTGAAYLQLGKTTAAAAAFKNAVRTDPQNLSMLDFIHQAYRDQNIPKLQVELMEELKDIVPGSAALYALLGETLSLQLGEHKKALVAFADALVLDPERSDYYNAMGLAHYRLHDYQAALRQFAAATELDPSDSSAHYNQACALALLGKADEALVKLGEALALDPRLASNARRDGDFAAIKNQPRFTELVSVPDASEMLGH